MDWNGGSSNLKTFGTRPVADSAFSFLYNCNYDQYSGMEGRQQGSMSMSTETVHGMNMNSMSSYGNNIVSMEKKKRLTNEQLESLERSFQEEIKLDPDRKMKLSRELGLQPRQIAVWFQNRRARWKTKQLERLYDGLKQEFDAISREKIRLQEEVLKLKSMLVREQGGTIRKQVMTSTDVSGEETVESTSEAIRSSSNNMIKPRPGATRTQQQQQMNMAECSYMFNNMEDYSNNPIVGSISVSVPQTYWGGVGVSSVPLLPPSFP